jgi:hypothetical protein
MIVDDLLYAYYLTEFRQKHQDEHFQASSCRLA